MNEARYCSTCGTLIGSSANFCSNCGGRSSSEGAPVRATRPTGQADINTDNLFRKLADYERLSGILWILIGVLQVFTFWGAIAGIWNLFAGYSRIKIAPRIRARDRSVPAEFDGIAQLAILAVINVLLGGVIGIVFVIFDYIIREKILDNRHLFDGGLAAQEVTLVTPSSAAIQK